MKKFLQLFDKVRSTGLRSKEFDLDVLVTCQPFVVEHDGTEIDITNKEFKPIDGLPFKIFSVEFSNEHPLQVVQVEQDADRKMKIVCYVYLEVNPEQYIYVALCESMDGRQALMVREMFDHIPEVQRIFDNVAASTLRSFLEALDTQQVGHIDPNQRIKYKNPETKEKITKTINQVVYIRNKKKSEQQVCYMGRTVEWNHRWTVRGHWRRCQGKVGKNREGVYNVENFTWVKDHVRGPEDAPVVMKQRIVTNGLQA